MRIIGSQIRDSIRTALATIFFLGYFSINFELNIWLIGPSNPEMELKSATIKLLEFIAIANGEI